MQQRAPLSSQPEPAPLPEEPVAQELVPLEALTFDERRPRRRRAQPRRHRTEPRRRKGPAGLVGAAALAVLATVPSAVTLIDTDPEPAAKDADAPSDTARVERPGRSAAATRARAERRREVRTRAAAARKAREHARRVITRRKARAAAAEARRRAKRPARPAPRRQAAPARTRESAAASPAMPRRSAPPRDGDFREEFF